MASADSGDKVADVIEPLLEELLHSDLNWFSVEFAPTAENKKKYELKFSNKGKGGLTELRENLNADDRIFYGSLQVDLIDANGSRYDKYVYFKYLPNKANKAKRFLWGWENPIKTAFKFKHVMFEYLDENLTGFTEEGITKEFLRVSENQMEYNSLDFGGNNIYKLQGGKVGPPKHNNDKNKAKEEVKDDSNDNNNDNNEQNEDGKQESENYQMQSANDENENANNNDNNGGDDNADAADGGGDE